MVQDPAPALIQPGPMPHAPDQEKQPLPCPRCESMNTKFCYYNNYNLSQPRHFCKDCRRYWTKGGALRNVPIGGATRKNTKRRPSSSLPNNHPKRVSLPATSDPLKPEPLPAAYPEDQMSFRSLLGCSGNFVNYLQEGGEMVGAGVELQGSNDTSVSGIPSPPEMGNLLGFQGEYRCWSGGWPDLAIFTTPGSGYQ